MELINKEELRDKMYHEAFEVDSELQKWESGCWIRYKLFEKILEELPTIESRPKGRWIKWGSEVKCSECHICNPINKPFCPNCGADMRGDME